MPSKEVIEFLAVLFKKICVSFPCPSQAVCQDFKKIFQHSPHQAVDFLCRFYNVSRMRLIVDDESCISEKAYAWYNYPKGYFRDLSIDKIDDILHEFYHHLSEVFGHTQNDFLEELGAEIYSHDFMQTMNGG